MEQLYSEKEALEKAQAIYHTKINSLQLQICSLITQRTQKAHPRTGVVTFQCPVCQLSVYDIETIHQHLKTVHQDNETLHSSPNASIPASPILPNTPLASAATATATSPPIPAATVTPGHHQDAVKVFYELTTNWLRRTTSTDNTSPGCIVLPDTPSTGSPSINSPLFGSSWGLHPVL